MAEEGDNSYGRRIYCPAYCSHSNDNYKVVDHNKIDFSFNLKT